MLLRLGRGKWALPLRDRDDMILKIDVQGFEELNLDRIRKFLDECEYLVFYVMEDGTPSQDESWTQKLLVNLFACPKALRKTVSRVLS